MIKPLLQASSYGRDVSGPRLDHIGELDMDEEWR